MKRYDVYRCSLCGNQVEAMKDGPGQLFCCGQAMLPVEKSDRPCTNPMFYIGYGLYVLSTKVTTKDNDFKDNGCIVNTVAQLTETPRQIMVTVNKKNLTHDMIMESRQFNISILTEETPFELFKNFGFQSGSTVDKFQRIKVERSPNGILYLTNYANSYISGKVTAIQDLGTHSMFFAEVVDSAILCQERTATYDFYQRCIKPAPPKSNPPQNGTVKKTRWVCKICGYIVEADELPPDFECPMCKHPASDFEKLDD